MEVTELCGTMLLNMLLLLPAQCQSSPSAQRADAAYPRVEPNRLQFFEYESVSLNCSGFPGPAGWRVMRKQTNSGSSQWENWTRWLLLKPAFVSHSGEYWCQSGEGERSRSVNISVTADDVILESPALPVMEGHAVTLRCRKRGHSNLPADFYKDGHLTGTGYEGEMIIESVSKSDEGFYKCSISGAAGASAESWLAVTDVARIVPSSLQLFDYGSVSFTCEGPNTSSGWRVLRRIEGRVSTCVSTWESPTPSVCAIRPVYPTDSGEYWCESGEGERTSTVNITVTAGFVILESPSLPVLEGEAVTLRCRTKTSSSTHVADFYKDGLHVGTGSFGEMTIASVSESDEGSYKCSISDFGESPESWLAVSCEPGLCAQQELTQSGRPGRIPAPSGPSCHIYLMLRAVFTVLMVALLLLLVGMLHCGKLSYTQRLSSLLLQEQ